MHIKATTQNSTVHMPTYTQHLNSSCRFNAQEWTVTIVALAVEVHYLFTEYKGYKTTKPNYKKHDFDTVNGGQIVKAVLKMDMAFHRVNHGFYASHCTSASPARCPLGHVPDVYITFSDYS